MIKDSDMKSAESEHEVRQPWVTPLLTELRPERTGRFTPKAADAAPATTSPRA
jgi:hypothetical protein